MKSWSEITLFTRKPKLIISNLIHHVGAGWMRFQRPYSDVRNVNNYLGTVYVHNRTPRCKYVYFSAETIVPISILFVCGRRGCFRCSEGGRERLKSILGLGYIGFLFSFIFSVRRELDAVRFVFGDGRLWRQQGRRGTVEMVLDG